MAPTEFFAFCHLITFFRKLPTNHIKLYYNTYIICMENSLVYSENDFSDFHK